MNFIAAPLFNLWHFYNFYLVFEETALKLNALYSLLKPPFHLVLQVNVYFLISLEGCKKQ